VADPRGLERTAAERAIAGLAVGDDRAHERSEQRAREPVGDVPVPGHSVGVAGEAGARDVPRAPARDRVQQSGELVRVVLAVAVEIDRRVVAAAARRLESLPHGGAEPG
jgi:hypothetical protein